VRSSGDLHRHRLIVGFRFLLFVFATVRER